MVMEQPTLSNLINNKIKISQLDNEMDDLLRSGQKDEYDMSKVEHLVPFREQLRKALQSKQSMGYKGSGKEKQGFSLGTILDLTNCVLNIMLAALYIASTYKPHELAK